MGGILAVLNLQRYGLICSEIPLQRQFGPQVIDKGQPIKLDSGARTQIYKAGDIYSVGNRVMTVAIVITVGHRRRYNPIT